MIRRLFLATGLALTVLGASQSAAFLRKDDVSPSGLLLEVSLPPLSVAPGSSKAAPLDVKGTLGKEYADKADPESRYCQAIHKAQVLLWASSPAAPPRPLLADVAEVRKELKLKPGLLRIRFAIPANAKQEIQLKNLALSVNQTVARLVARMEDTLEELNAVAQDHKKQPLRWQANHSLMRASLLLRMSALDDFSLALGTLRKELPPRDKDDRAWRIKATESIHDFAARKRIKEALHVLQRLRKDYPGTVWDQQAERLARSKLGSDWEAIK